MNKKAQETEEVTALDEFEANITIGEVETIAEFLGDLDPEDLNTAQQMALTAITAASRLGHTLSVEDARTLQMKDVERIIAAADKVPAPKRSAAAAALMESLPPIEDKSVLGK
ncbi:hypothetical protein [Boudabousia marimammalium]|uniref:Uncharacterized protein n=1 Tax=Boudabousia marimammalium TaxID=156892 RepID=A0A1Q5PPG7_9ACTO|nr:hypothetical protein [Boudabousia marimammalium]OKL49295.1 hypothetical protein BM477_04750 [Boudabousia marimammalium]